MSDTQLFGWKEIAKHLHCCVRTAKTYHYEGKMPVIRGNGMGVRAIVSELDCWIEMYYKKAGSRPNGLKRK